MCWIVLRINHLMASTYPKDVGFSPVSSRNIPFLFLCFHLLYLLLPLLIVLTPFMSCFHLLVTGDFTSFDKRILTCAALYYATWVFTAQLTKTGGSNRLLNSNPLLSYILSSIPISIRLTSEIKVQDSPSGSYIFPCHPHGALAFNRAAVGFCMDDLWDAAFPQLPNLKVLVASAAFYVPLIRELWLASYCIEASKKVAVAALKDGGRGTGMLVYPGGETEQLLTIRGKERVYLSGRKGFIKLALERGCEVVPVYAFGESDLYEHSQLLIGLRRTIQKKMGAAIPLIYGQVSVHKRSEVRSQS